MIDVDYMLTTVDNPHSPFTDYEAWYLYDRVNGHNTNEVLARHGNYTELSGDDDILLMMIDIVRHDPTGKRVMVTRDTYKLLCGVKDVPPPG